MVEKFGAYAMKHAAAGESWILTLRNVQKMQPTTAWAFEWTGLRRPAETGGGGVRTVVVSATINIPRAS